MMRLTRNGFEPASPYDYELLSQLKPGTVVEVRAVEKERSPALSAWWHICNRTAAVMDETHTARSISNSMLLEMGLVEKHLTHGGGTIHEPMSLTDFDEDQLWRLFEFAKLYVETTLIPGVDIEKLLETRHRRY